MDNRIKIAIGFCAGLVMGSAASYLYFKTKDEAEMSKAIDKEVNLFKAEYAAKMEEKKKPNEPEEVEEPPMDEEAKTDLSSTYSSLTTEYSNENKTDYSTFYEVPWEEEDDKIDDKLREKEELEERSNSEPYIITSLDFALKDDYDIVSLDYFYDDNILCDDTGVIIENPEEYIGPLALSSFDVDTPEIYVRNDKLKIDYEIVLDLRHYDDVNYNGPAKY